MRRLLVLATLACAACRAVPTPPPPGPDHPASPQATEVAAPALRGTASDLVRAPESRPGGTGAGMRGAGMGGGR